MEIINYTTKETRNYIPIKDVYKLNLSTKKAKKIIKSLLNKKVIKPFNEVQLSTQRTVVHKDTIL